MPGTEHKIRCVILGGGGHARVVIDCLKLSKLAFPHAVLDENQSLWGTEIFGVPVRGGDDCLGQLKKEGVTHFIPAVGGIRDNSPRRRVFTWARDQGLIPLVLCHPAAIISPYAQIGGGTVVFAGAILNPGVTVGENCIINTGAILDHDCVIGDHVHIAPGAALSGTVRVGSGAHIGTGACIRQDIIIGEEAVVGVGSVVIQDVPAKKVVKGVPAK